MLYLANINNLRLYQFFQTRLPCVHRDTGTHKRNQWVIKAQMLGIFRLDSGAYREQGKDNSLKQCLKGIMTFIGIKHLENSYIFL